MSTVVLNSAPALPLSLAPQSLPCLVATSTSPIEAQAQAQAQALALPAKSLPQQPSSQPTTLASAPAQSVAPASAPSAVKFSHDLVKYRCVQPQDQEEMRTIGVLEAEAFPPDEMTSLANINKFANQASTFLRVATYKEEIVGYVMATLTRHEHVNSEVLKQHDEEGCHLYIHSVVVKKAFRGGGFGRKMLDRFVDYVKEECSTFGVSAILLVAKQHLIPFYENAGFNLVGEADVQMGADQWFEFRMDLELPQE